MSHIQLMFNMETLFFVYFLFRFLCGSILNFKHPSEIVCSKEETIEEICFELRIIYTFNNMDFI